MSDTDPQARAAEVLREHKVERDGLSTSYFGPTVGWWRCSCGETSPNWENYYRNRETDWPTAHVAAALAEAGLLADGTASLLLPTVIEERNAARAELAEVKAERDMQVENANAMIRNAQRANDRAERTEAELAEVKAERDKYLIAANDFADEIIRLDALTRDSRTPSGVVALARIEGGA